MVIFLANQFIGYKLSTGGDMVAFEVAKRVFDEKVILAPQSIHAAIKSLIPTAAFISTDPDDSVTSASSIAGGLRTVWLYAKRTTTSVTWLLSETRQGDTIYLTGDFICNSLPALITKLRFKKIKILANFYHRNPPPSSRPGNPYLVSLSSRWLQTISLFFIKRIADVIFVLSDEGKHELLKEGFDPRKIVVSGAGADTTFAHKFRNQKKTRGQLVFIGRLNITKGAFELIEMLGEVAKRGHDFSCYLIGFGAETDISKIKSLLQTHHLQNRVHLTGYVSEQKKYQILSKSVGLLLPSKEEGFGIVILEALAVGVPSICYDLPALRVLFNRYPQVNFIPPGNRAAFIQAICDLLSQSPHQRFKVKFPTWNDVYQIQSRYF